MNNIKYFQFKINLSIIVLKHNTYTIQCMQIKSAQFADSLFSGLPVEADCSLPQSPLDLRSDLSLNNIPSSCSNCSRKQLRYNTLFRCRARTNLQLEK